MDQTTETAVDTSLVQDAYAEHVKNVRKRQEEEEAKTPKPETCHIEMDYDACEALLDLISKHYNQYGTRSQAYLIRAAKSLEAGLLAAAKP
jgi:hypothetical protein